MPLSFYLVLIIAAFTGFFAFKARNQGWGFPAVAVIITVVSWYIGDALYNNYGVYKAMFSEELLNHAWLQVCLFLIAFTFLTPRLHRSINRNLLSQQSFVVKCYEARILDSPRIQQRIDQITVSLLWVWIALMLIALIRVKFDALSLFAPYLSGAKVDPWARGRLGGGLDAVISFASYLQSFLATAFGIILAIAKNRRTRQIAAIICFLALPFYIFDRTRYLIIVTILPGFLAWVFLRLQHTLLVKTGILLGAFLLLNFWFTFVIAVRGEGKSISKAFKAGVEEESLEEITHHGFNMFEELVWMNSMIKTGRYDVKWGYRYFAELSNPIPRALWRSKPLIGIDYAIARGQAKTGGSEIVTATISTGLIGQGIDNFGRVLGPIGAALVVALWSVLLARQDLLANFEPERVLLFATGLMMTFPMGRDISLLLLYPFFFGLGILIVWRKHRESVLPTSDLKAAAPNKTRKPSR